MFPCKSSLTLVFTTALVVAASPLKRNTGKTTLLFATKFIDDDMFNLVENNRARAQVLGFGSNPSSEITNIGVAYTVQVGVGEPATDYTLVLDTGSANTYLGANPNKPYVQTSSSQDTGNTVSTKYSIGGFSGEEWLDTVTLGPDLVIHQQSIGIANSSTGLSKMQVDGILGLGPVDLTAGTVNNTKTVPTVMDNLMSQGTISEEVLGMYFIPVSSGSYGELTFGGYDDSAITRDVSYVPITKTPPSAIFWGIDQSISYGDTAILSPTAGIVDSGSSLILIASDAFQKYQEATGATIDSNNGFLSITSEQYDSLKPLTFHIGDASYDLTPNGQIWPRALNARIGGTADSIYLVIADIGWKTGLGYDFVNGYPFLERFYSVYDTTNGRVGFASTHYTDSTDN